MAHFGNAFVFTTDIEKFYPSIRYERVGDLFRQLGCSDRVAQMCTRLTTHDAVLSQGFCTSPILADRMLAPVDKDISRACENLNLTYTRFVDDISVSGSFDLRKSNIPDVIRRVVRCHGFKINTDKETSETSLTDGKATITNIRVLADRLDVPTAYYNGLVAQLEAHATLANGGAFTEPYMTQEQLWGKVEYVCSINPNRRRYLYKLLRNIHWPAARAQAEQIGLIVCSNVMKLVARSR